MKEAHGFDLQQTVLAMGKACGGNTTKREIDRDRDRNR
jgi:hypothetical protein